MKSSVAISYSFAIKVSMDLNFKGSFEMKVSHSLHSIIHGLKNHIRFFVDNWGLLSFFASDGRPKLCCCYCFMYRFCQPSKTTRQGSRLN